MFTRWHREFLGQACYLKVVARQIKAQGLTKCTVRRTLVLGADEIASGSSITSAPDLLAALATTGFGTGKLRDARPWTVVLEASADTMREIKAALVRQGVMIHDGFEDLCFSSKFFDRGPIINTGAKGSRIAATSYDLRVLRLDTYARHADTLDPPGTLLTFRTAPVQLNFAGPGPRRLDVAGCNIEQIADLLEAFK
jgi:hypothetical protein